MGRVCLEESLILVGFFFAGEAVPAVSSHEKGLGLPLEILFRNSISFVSMVTLVAYDLWLIENVDLLLRD